MGELSTEHCLPTKLETLFAQKDGNFIIKLEKVQQRKHAQKQIFSRCTKSIESRLQSLQRRRLGTGGTRTKLGHKQCRASEIATASRAPLI